MVGSLQRARLAEDAVLALLAEVAADVGGVAARQQHAAFLGGDDARRGGELVGLEDHRFVEERLDQVERDRGDAVEGDVLGADLRRQPGIAGAADRRAHAQAGPAVRLVEEEDLAREDEVRVPDLLEVHAPELGPAPRALQVQPGDAPERVAALDGVDVGRVRQQLAQRNARFGGLLRGRALLRRDREVGLGGEAPRPRASSRARRRRVAEVRAVQGEFVGSCRKSRGGEESAHALGPKGLPRRGGCLSAVRRKSHLVSQILPIKH